jgi:hypothetical protein
MVHVAALRDLDILSVRPSLVEDAPLVGDALDAHPTVTDAAVAAMTAECFDTRLRAVGPHAPMSQRLSGLLPNVGIDEAGTIVSNR